MPRTTAPNVVPGSGSMSNMRAMGPSSLSAHDTGLPMIKETAGRRPAVPRVRSGALLDHDLDAAILRLAHAVSGRHQQSLLADPGNRDRRGRNAVAHQGVLDGIGAAQRQ